MEKRDVLEKGSGEKAWQRTKLGATIALQEALGY